MQKQGNSWGHGENIITCVFFFNPSPVRRVPIPTGIQRKLNFVSVRTIKGWSSSGLGPVRNQVLYHRVRLFSLVLVPLVWESNPKLQGDWCKSLIGKQNKPTRLSLRSPSRVPYRTELLPRAPNVGVPGPLTRNPRPSDLWLVTCDCNCVVTVYSVFSIQ